MINYLLLFTIYWHIKQTNLRNMLRVETNFYCCCGFVDFDYHIYDLILIIFSLAAILCMVANFRNECLSKFIFSILVAFSGNHAVSIQGRSNCNSVYHTSILDYRSYIIVRV